MAQFALVQSGVVINILEWDGDLKRWSPPAGQVCIPAAAARIGDFWDGTSFTTPPAAPPEPVRSDVDLLADLLRTKNIITAQERAELRATTRSTR